MREKRGGKAEHVGKPDENGHRKTSFVGGSRISVPRRGDPGPPAGGVTRRATLAGGGVAALLSLAHLTGDALNSMLSALLPTLQERFGLSATTLALLVATIWFSSALTQPLFGALSDRVREEGGVGSLGVILNTVLLSLVGVVPAVWLLFGVLLVGGFGSAALHPVGTKRGADGGWQEQGARHRALQRGGHDRVRRRAGGHPLRCRHVRGGRDAVAYDPRRNLGRADVVFPAGRGSPRGRRGGRSARARSPQGLRLRPLFGDRSVC